MQVFVASPGPGVSLPLLSTCNRLHLSSGTISSLGGQMALVASHFTSSQVQVYAGKRENPPLLP